MLNNDIKGLVDTSVGHAHVIMGRNMIKYHKRFPKQCATNGIYGSYDGFWSDWHPGLYVGMFYLGYKIWGDIKFRKYAECMGNILYNVILQQGNIWHSDIGLVYLPCAIPDISYNKSKTAKHIIIAAADCLAEKMAHGGRFIDINFFDLHTHRVKQTYLITQITNLNNTHLLKLAAEYSGNSKYLSLAEGSIESVFKYNISPDGRVALRCKINKKDLSVCKRYFSDKMSQEQDKQRGYGWAIWNLAKCYSAQKDDIFLKKFSLVFDYLCKEFPDIFLYKPNDETQNQYYDSSAAAISLCGFLEMAENLNPSDKLREKCLDFAETIFKDIYANSLCRSDTGDECLIENGFKFYDDMKYRSKTSGTIPGDYFWLQSIIKLKNMLEKEDTYDNT